MAEAHDVVAAGRQLADKSSARCRRTAPDLLQRIYRHRADYLYVLPSLGVMFLVIGYPIYYTVHLSFFKTPPSLAMEDKIFVGLENYQRLLGNDRFHEVTWNTVIWTVYSTVFAFVLGFAAALVLNREFHGRAWCAAFSWCPS